MKVSPHMTHKHSFTSHNSPRGELWHKVVPFLVVLTQVCIVVLTQVVEQVCIVLGIMLGTQLLAQFCATTRHKVSYDW